MTRLATFFLFFIAGTTLAAQTPVITVRFANPDYNCTTGEYCVDVEFQSDTTGQQLFGMNVRFFYDDDILELIDFRDFEDGYGTVAPDPPNINTSGPAGPLLFNFPGPAEFVNGAIQRVDPNAPPIFISTTGWARLFSICFQVDNAPDLDVFCPSIIWDLEEDPANGGFPQGDDGVVITLAHPDPGQGSLPATENVEQFNWEYDGIPGIPYGMPNPTDCISVRCIDLSLELEADTLTPDVGSNVLFTITVTNAMGFDPATNVEVTSLLPNGFAYVSDDGGGTYDDGTGLWVIDTLIGGDTTLLNITATVNPSGDYLLLAEVTATMGKDEDSTPNNGVDTDNDMQVVDDPDDEDDGDGVLISPFAPENPELTVEKVDELLDEGDGIQAGDLIDYTITITNTGNLPIAGVILTDPNLTSVACFPSQGASLAPGQSMVCAGFVILTQADIDLGSYTNTAIASGLASNGSPVSDESDDPDTPEPNDPTVTLLLQPSGLTVEKVDVLDDGGDGLQAGDFIEYAITVTNTGSVTLSDITVNDPELTDVVCVPTTPATLAPGESMLCTGRVTLTQADIDAGSYSNTATADGFDSNGNPISDESDDPDTPAPNDPTMTTLLAVPALSVLKTDTLNLGVDDLLNPGDLITYHITVTNTGNVSLSDIVVSDPNASGLACLPATPFGLAPGASVTCTATHTLSQTDIDAGFYSNVATATGLAPDNTMVTDDSDDPDDPADLDPDGDGNPDDPTVTEFPCLLIKAWIYLEGAAIHADGSDNYTLPMRTTLNDLHLLPGQAYLDMFQEVQYSPPGQPYNVAPWNYMGNEGDNYDSEADLNFGDADYPPTVVDWVLVSLRLDPDETEEPICQTAALLHENGNIEFVEDFECCDLDPNQSYYLLVEHWNHLIVMSHMPIPLASGSISYDFRAQQSYINDPYSFGVFAGQKEFLSGIYGMYGGNGNQTLSTRADTDFNFDDRTYWEIENGDLAKYRQADYNLNGDTNFNDLRVLEFSIGKFTSVLRNY